MKLLPTLLFSAWLCIKASNAFMLLVRAPGTAPSLAYNAIDYSVRIRALHAAPTTATTAAVTTTATININRGRRGKRRREVSSGLSMAMKGRPAPQLSEEELTAMGNAREKANRKVEEFLKTKRAEKETRRKEEQAEQRSKIVSRIKAEQEDVEHKKVYIPQRLEEIEKEQALLSDRMSAFNAKIKGNKEIKEL